MKSLLPILLLAITSSSFAAEKPLSLHPRNAHYFLFRGKPTILVTSAEHYGAVLNTDFDFDKYLDELGTRGLNLTRIFSGVYCEDTKAFGITHNTLAPTEGKLTCPWARSEAPGYAGGGNKFDLTKWDNAYFKRLKTFLTQAGRRGIVVEFVLFCPFYEDSMWKLSPMNATNNVNGIGTVERQSVYNRQTNDRLQAAQEGVVEKLVTELNEFDNLYFEICNEPYFGGVTEDWQRRIVDVIVKAEEPLPNKHLISQNIANGSKKIEKPYPAVSVFNFHYSSPPTAVRENFGLNKVIGENETGFKGTGDKHYRMEAWEFLLAGGGLYNNLDYSFAVGQEDGTYKYPDTTPGGGNVGFRNQIAVLKTFLDGYDFLRMKPDESLVKGGLPAKARATALSEPGMHYAVYFFGGPRVKPLLALPAGKYEAEWISPVTGKVLKTDAITAKEVPVELVSPDFEPDIAVRIKRSESK
jgi:hypothetical protein